jgi:hypothetical protein
MMAMREDSMSVASAAKQSLDASSPLAEGLEARVAARGDEAIRTRR